MLVAFLWWELSKMFSPLRFSYSFGAHESIMTSLYLVHQWRQTGNRAVRRCEVTCLLVGIVGPFQQMRPSRHSPKTSRKWMGGSLKLYYSLCSAHNSHFYFYPVSLTYLRLNGEMNVLSQAFRKTAGTCQIKYATGCTCRSMQLPKYFRGNSNLFKISAL